MPDTDDVALRIPIVKETVVVARTEVTTDAVRVRTFSENQDVVVEDTVERGVLHVERVAVDRLVDVAPPVRHEGDTMIVSLVEERLIVEKRLFVVEEVHVTRLAEQGRVSIPVTLRTTRASIERPTDITTGNDTNG